MAEEHVVAFPMWLMLGGGIAALVVLGGAFALIYWLMSRGRDDEHSP